tara:strand:- start:324 stop:557 length:234 start_codon:yes stop_codon:yes gene_type:complete
MKHLIGKKFRRVKYGMTEYELTCDTILPQHSNLEWLHHGGSVSIKRLKDWVLVDWIIYTENNHAFKLSEVEFKNERI